MRDWVFHLARWVSEVIKRSDSTKGFVVLPRRWVVERTFAWLGRYRRLSKDYEQLTQTSEAMIYAAVIRLMLKRLDASPAIQAFLESPMEMAQRMKISVIIPTFNEESSIGKIIVDIPKYSLQ